MTTTSFMDFETAGRATLQFLQQRMGFGLWMITRVEGNDWIVLQTEDESYGVKPGQVFNWADSFCSQMIKGLGPRIAPNADEVPVYASAAIGRLVPIKSYIGQPIMQEDGTLFGTLCAIDPVVKPESLKEEQSLIELLGGLLSSILQKELRENTHIRRAERLEAEILTDELTQLYNRRGWDRLLEAEENRCRRHGNPAALYILDLDNLKYVNDTFGHAAGDDLIKRAAEALAYAARTDDIVARLGGDEFGIISIECDEKGARTFLKRIEEILSRHEVKASIGYALRHPASGLQTAWVHADEQMYVKKKNRKA